MADNSSIKVGILGSGAMGTGIAQVAALAGHEVYLYDQQSAALERAHATLERYIPRLAEKGKITQAAAQAALNRVHTVDTIASLADCSLVLEAIVEHLSVKQELMRQLEAVVSKDTLLATNTSSLPVAAIASACAEPGRVIGIHFFNPAPLMKLVEVIPAIQTTADTLYRARQWVDGLGKTTVQAMDTPGFIVNRVARPFYGEALRIYEEGIADPATIDWAMTELGGFRMGPFTLMDYIGHDVNYTVTETIFKAFYYDPRYKPSFAQQRLVNAGYLGRKTGRGFYHYAEGTERTPPVKDIGLGRAVLWRIVVMLINEAADALYYGIATAEDIETAMTLGVNYPKGLLHWADEVGIEHCMRSVDALYHEYHEDRYRCSALLRSMVRKQEHFFAAPAAE